MTDDLFTAEDRAWLKGLASADAQAVPARPEVPVRLLSLWILFALAWDAYWAGVSACWSWFERQEGPVKLLTMFLAAFALAFLVAFYG